MFDPGAVAGKTISHSVLRLQTCQQIRIRSTSLGIVNYLYNLYPVKYKVQVPNKPALIFQITENHVILELISLMLLDVILMAFLNGNFIMEISKKIAQKLFI